MHRLEEDISWLVDNYDYINKDDVNKNINVYNILLIIYVPALIVKAKSLTTVNKPTPAININAPIT